MVTCNMKKYILTYSIVIGLFLFPFLAFGQGLINSGTISNSLKDAAGIGGLPAASEDVSSGGLDFAFRFAGGAFQRAVPVVSIIIFILIIVGGILYAIGVAQGNTSMIDRAKNTIKWTVIGTAVIFGAYGILRVIYIAVLGNLL